MSSRSSSPAPPQVGAAAAGPSSSSGNRSGSRDRRSTASRRLTLTRSHLRATKNHRHDDRPGEERWNPNWNHFPLRRNLRRIPGAPAGAAWFWGADDNLGRLNLLTPKRVLKAKDEIGSGEVISVNLPLHEPSPPAFTRPAFKHEIHGNGNGISFDDSYTLNTQSGTQWDGFRHWSHLATKTFYNNTKPSDILGDTANASKCSIHHWSQHGIAGRALLLDFWSYAQRKRIAYHPYAHDVITLDHLKQCARHQRIDIRPQSAGGTQLRVGDILLVRTGYAAVNALMPAREREAYAKRPRGQATFSGLAQSEDMVDWLHNCYFAAAASDSPAFEVWPPKNGALEGAFAATTATDGGNGGGGATAQVGERGLLLHEHMLALWGMPLGELLDLEQLAQRCREREKWFFFFTSAPANVVGGVASHVNGQAIL